MELNYGKTITRGLLHFDECDIKRLVEDKTFADTDKLSFHLKMTNCFSVDGLPYEKRLMRGDTLNVHRASSFDLLIFKLPQYFDGGRGFDYISDFWNKENKSVTRHGSSWYFSEDGLLWPSDYSRIDYDDPNLNIDVENGRVWMLSGNTRVRINLEGGVYSKETIEEEYDKFVSGEDSIFIAQQHFDFGNENLDMDITNYVLDVINGIQENHGLGIMFSPMMEGWETERQQYVGFFTDHTNTYFHPYIECIYDETINDGRDSVCVGKKNRLYLYVDEDGEPKNLDNMPSCTIEGADCEVKQATKGVYYAEFMASKDDFTPGTVGYDTWSNLSMDGVELDDVELEFEINSPKFSTKIGSKSTNTHEIVPSVYGINDAETLTRHEVREVNVDFRRKYTTDIKEVTDNAYYRLYVKDGNREITIIDTTPIEKEFQNNYFIIHTEDLIPNNYFVDITVKHGRETSYYREVLRFTVVSDVTHRYE